MNIEIIQDHITTFTREVVDSGFKRDLDDYASSLPASQQNIVALRDIAAKVLSVLDRLYSSDLPDSLKSVLPKKELRPFTEEPHDSNLRALIENTEIQQQEFFNQLTKFINRIVSQIQANLQEITKIDEFLLPYKSRDLEQIAKDDLAIIAIVLKEHQTITSLEQFTKTITAWNRVLRIYHQLLKSESPKDIQIVEIQNESIDLIINLNLDIALDLVELFKVGFMTFGAYLSYKQMLKPIIDSYHGNQKLIKGEDEREKDLLDNIGTAIKKQVEAQHKKAKKADKKVDGTAVPKKVEQVTKLISSHIVKGNDMKLLAVPKTVEGDDGKEEILDERDALRKESMKARSMLRLTPIDTQQRLLEVYETPLEDTE